MQSRPHQRRPPRVVYPRTRFDSQQLARIPAAADRAVQTTFVVIVSAEPRKNLNMFETFAGRAIAAERAARSSVLIAH
jgi:hypothetical protein